MKIYKEKCDIRNCGKVIEGTSDKEVKAWMNQHKMFMHPKELEETK